MNTKIMCDKIRGKRNEKRLSQEDVALKLGISTRAYNFKENNKTNFKVEELFNLANILKCNINDFFSKEM